MASASVSTTAATDTGTATALQVLACIIMVCSAAVHLIKVIPTHASSMASWGQAFSAPTRVALSVGRFGWFLALAFAVGLGVLAARGRRGERERAHFHLALGLTLVLLAAYSFLVTWAYVDVATALPAAAGR